MGRIAWRLTILHFRDQYHEDADWSYLIHSVFDCFFLLSFLFLLFTAFSLYLSLFLSRDTHALLHFLFAAVPSVFFETSE